MESAIKVVRAVQIAFLVSVVLYVGVGEKVGSIERLNEPVLFYVLSLVTIIIVGVILVVRRTLVLQSALAEAIALFGLVLRFIGFTLSQVWSFYIAGFILLLFFGPRLPESETN